MSGLLRRIKRSRPADAGEPPVEGQAAAPEGGAAPQGEPAATPDAATPETAAPRAWLTSGEPEPQAAAAPSATEAPKPPEPPKPVLVANPDAPAGLELENQTTPRPPAGRRGRLRRRLRYLRRARELMLRDLGGLLYEVHRSGGGNVDAHATVLTAKVQRISGLDAEAHALETALASPRPDAVIFEPGIGGTCPNCGELFSSASHFCANCGASVTDLPAPPAPTGQLAMDVEAATPAPVAEPYAQPDQRGFWKKAVGGRKRAAAVPGPGAGAESPTHVLAPGADEAASVAPTTTDEPAEAAEPPAGERASADTAAEPATAEMAPAETAPDPPAADAPTETAAPPADPPADATGGDDAPHRDDRSNGAGRAPDEVAEADPLVTRRSPS